jgi:hypothetical protein
MSVTKMSEIGDPTMYIMDAYRSAILESMQPVEPEVMQDLYRPGYHTIQMRKAFGTPILDQYSTANYI